MIERGQIWWANLGPPTGSAPAKRRPVLVVQSDAFNASRISTVMVAVITSNQALAAAPGNVRLSRKQSRLPKVSVVNVSQVVTLDRDRLADRVATLDATLLQAVDDGLRLSLSL